VIGFVASAALVLSVRLPQPTPAAQAGGIYEKTTRGSRIYLATPRLRGLLALNLSVASAGAMVIVNTVVIVRALFGRPDSDVAIALGCFGGGSMAAALLLPRILDRLPDRRVMLPAAIFLGCVQLALAALFLGVVRRADLHRPRGRFGMAGDADRLGPARGRLLRNHDADRPASAALVATSRQAGGLRGAVRAVACLLAPDLSARRVARPLGRDATDVGGPRPCDPSRRGGRCCRLARR
jgi:hypothetical protein